MKQLALLWLVCAATGFVVAAGAAIILAVTVDNGAAWKHTLNVNTAKVFERVSQAPREALGSPIPSDVGRGWLQRW